MIEWGAGVLQTVETVEERGLSEAEVTASRERNGANVLVTRKRRSFFRELLGNFGDPIIRVLLIALAVNIIVLFREINWFETGGILLAVFLSTFVSTVSEWGSARAFERLREGSGTLCRVRRAGQTVEIPAEELVVGDIMLLGAGEMVQADARLLSGEIAVDQSALNGEGAEVTKYPGGRGNWDLASPGAVFRGSLVSSGAACVRVARVGGETLYGSLASELQEDTRESPLKLRLAHLAGQISRIGYIMAALVAVAYLFNAFFLSAGFDRAEILARLVNGRFVFTTLMHVVTLVITVIVVAVPEGLPMMITVVLSSNMKRMLKNGVLVRKMVGIETAGSMNILFTDKTGTLTEGKMSVLGVLSGDCVLYKTPRALTASPALAHALSTCVMGNSDSAMTDKGAVGGNATDRACLSFFYDETVTPPAVRARLPFSSERKYAATVTASGILCKGAPEVLLPRVVSRLTADGSIRLMGAKERQKFEYELHRCASQGERLLLLCRSDAGSGDTATLPPLTLLGAVILRDRVRREAPDAVGRLHRAGVRVVMVTGDAKETAVAIARESGIYCGVEGSVLGGEELAALSDEELSARLDRLAVVYRALPGDKSRLVRAAQMRGLVAGMTGDGVNDAPSLKLADVGFAMGSGTDIAREAGDIVILDDNIASIARTVLYGRTIFKSIRKFITFQLTMNLCAVGVSLFGQFIGIESPVTILQMLWVNIIMDTLGGLAFAGEPPLAMYMHEKPKKREEKILSGAMVHQIAVTGTYTLAVCAWFLASPWTARTFHRATSEVYFLTLFFALFIFCGIANCFAARSERMNLFSAIGRNKPFLFIMTFILGVQLAMLYFGGELFRTVPPAPLDLARIALLAVTVIPVDFIRRCFFRLHRRREE